MRKLFSVVAMTLVTHGAMAAEPLKVFAAGSLTGAMNSVIKLYEEKTGQQVQAEYGPAGLLRERIEGGEHPDIYASANMAHPQTLADKGLATQPVVMARNRLCAKALPDISLGYCSSRQTTPDPKFASVELPPEIAVHADYGLSVLSNQEAALRFALFVMSPEAQHVFGMYGFTPVAERYAAP